MHVALCPFSLALILMEEKKAGCCLCVCSCVCSCVHVTVFQSLPLDMKKKETIGCNNDRNAQSCFVFEMFERACMMLCL